MRKPIIAFLLAAAALHAQAADLLQTVKARGTLKVAMEGVYPPFNYQERNGELAGYDVDVARLVAGKLGLKAEFVTTEWASILAGLADQLWQWFAILPTVRTVGVMGDGRSYAHPIVLRAVTSQRSQAEGIVMRGVSFEVAPHLKWYTSA